MNSTPKPRKKAESQGKTKPEVIEILGVRYYLPYPRDHIKRRQHESYTEADRVEACVAEHALAHEYQSGRALDWPTGMLPARVIRKGKIEYMKLWDVARKLHLNRPNVTRGMKKVENERGTVSREHGRIYFVGRPPQMRVKGLPVVRSDNWKSLHHLQPPENHPQKEQWQTGLDAVDKRLNKRMKAFRATLEIEKFKGYAEVAAPFLGVTIKSLHITDPHAKATKKRPVRKVCTTLPDNLSPSVRTVPDNVSAQNTTVVDNPSEIKRIRGLSSTKEPRGQAGHSSAMESQPASQPGTSKKNKGQEADTEPESLERFVQDLNRQFTRRFAVPVTPKWAAKILSLLEGAEWQQLFDLITKKQHIRAWSGVAELAKECALTQNAWRDAETPTSQPRTSTAQERAKEYQRKRDDRKTTRPGRT